MLSSSKTSDEGIAQKKLLAELLQQSNRVEIYSASLAQQRLWFLDQLGGPLVCLQCPFGVLAARPS